ncbi:hypothetical protein [Streptomyces spiralis]
MQRGGRVETGLLWSQSLVLAGYTLGSSVPHVEDYLPPLVALVVVLSLLLLPAEARRTHAARRARDRSRRDRSRSASR